jgi:adenosylcobinamide-GDP ribazoletransferase
VPAPGGPAPLAGLRLAISTFTVIPVRAARVDRRSAGTAMILGPLIGAGLGSAVGGVGLGLRALHAAPSLAAAIAVAVGVLLTRGLHLDGLADTADALGSYRDAPGALQIMKKPDIGPFGVAAVVLTLLVQATSTGSLLDRGWPATVAGTAVLAASGRLAAAWACRPGMPAARPDGLGAFVAGTAARPALWMATAAVAALGLVAVPGRSWQGPLAVLVGQAAAAALTRHASRRLGGITGDVLGANVEVAASVTAVTLALG